MEAEYAIAAKLFINGTWSSGSSSRVIPDINPFDQTKIFDLPQASVKDVDLAYEAAQKAARDWGATPADQRCRLIGKACHIMVRRKEEIMAWLIRESGSTRIKAEIEWQAIVDHTRAWAHLPLHLKGEILNDSRPGKYSFVFREPLGVIGVISPWNFPLILSIRSVIPAIALGNTVVLKPASDTPVTGGLLIARILEEAGCPEGVINVVAGTGGEIGDYFVRHPIPSLISFTGSTAVGKQVGQQAMGAKILKRVSLELGGNSPLVVLDDADVEAAASAAVMGRFLHAGQICMSTNRIIVDQTREKEFMECFVAGVKQLKVGNPAEPDTVVGPVINESQLSGLLRKIEAGTQGGARQLLGGPPEGLLLPPHVFAPVSRDHILFREETFGPLCPVTVSRDEAHALALANDTEYGLSSAVFTSDMARGLAFSRGIAAGMTHINDITVDDQPLAPFGGEKNSGLGRFNGEYLMEEFTRGHWVTWTR